MLLITGDVIWKQLYTSCETECFNYKFECGNIQGGGGTLVFRMEDGYSLEKFHGSMLVDLSCQLQSWEKICN